MIDRDDRTLFYGQVIGHLLLTEGITFYTTSRMNGIVDVNVSSKFFTNEKLLIDVLEDDWNNGPSEAVRCRLLSAMLLDHIQFKPEYDVETIMVQDILNIRNRTLAHFRNSISRDWYERDIQKILSVYDRVFAQTDECMESCYGPEAVYELVAKAVETDPEQHLYIHITEKGYGVYYPTADEGFRIFDGGAYSNDDPNNDRLTYLMRELCQKDGFCFIDIRQRLTEDATKKFMKTVDDELGLKKMII